MSEKAFLNDLKHLLEKHPEQADSFTVKVPEDARLEGNDFAVVKEKKRCKRWGMLPGTNEVICLEWEDF